MNWITRLLRKDVGNPFRASALCWTARIVSVAATVFAAQWTLYYVNRQAELVFREYGFFVFLGLLPVPLTTIAWRWHLPGGLLMLLHSPFLLFFALVISVGSEGHVSVANLSIAAILLFVGAVLNPVLWWRQNKAG
jgi:hypothetical protein